ncbi:MAG: HEPN domain-containing protein [Bacteroidota bacterium]
MDNNNEWHKWIEYAENDFEAAKILSAQVKPKFEIICYHCQQCAEKMLKGYIALNNGKLQKIHDLVVLCETCATWDSDFEKIIGHCSDLTIYVSEVRYPNVLEIEHYHMQNAINDAVNIKDFVLSKLTDMV